MKKRSESDWERRKRKREAEGTIGFKDDDGSISVLSSVTSHRREISRCAVLFCLFVHRHGFSSRAAFLRPAAGITASGQQFSGVYPKENENELTNSWTLGYVRFYNLAPFLSLLINPFISHDTLCQYNIAFIHLQDERT